MYARCLFCNRDLGRNEAIEVFPVGRRLAYDAAKGRLWVVCAACGRWNLTPLEERWEAIEQAERLYRGTRLRSATDNIGLARVVDGTDLVRVGRPLRPEFAAWRYGAQLGRRRRRQAAVTGGALTVLGGLAAAAVVSGAVGHILGAGVLGWRFLAWAGNTAYTHAVHGRPKAEVARWRDADGVLLRVRRLHLTESRIEVAGESGDTALRVRHDGGERVYTGEALLRVAGRVFPAANRFGGNAREVGAALAHIDREGGAEGFVAALTRGPTRAHRMRRMLTGDDSRAAHLLDMRLDVRLAVEMAAHEEQERRALEGELAALEGAWREAEEIAAIADDLLVPDRVRQDLARLRRPRGAA